MEGREWLRRRGRLLILLPDSQRRQRFVQEGGAAGVPLNFAAGGFGDGSGVDEGDGGRGDVVLAGNAGANGGDDGLGVCLVCFLAQFCHDRQLLRYGRLYGKGGHAAGAHCRMALLHGAFNVLRVMVAPANDNQVFQATRDK